MCRRLAILFLSALSLAILPSVTLAQGAYPTKTVRFLVPFPAGGINDILARIVVEKLQTKWGQPIVIENKTGAGGNIGADLAAHADPDGYTLFASAPGPLAINQSLYKQLSYKPEEFVPITGLGKVPTCSSFARTSQPIRSRS
jgi:tripartite-type tricarboxylate transporter receptor subunit TctC